MADTAGTLVGQGASPALTSQLLNGDIQDAGFMLANGSGAGSDQDDVWAIMEGS